MEYISYTIYVHMNKHICFVFVLFFVHLFTILYVYIYIYIIRYVYMTDGVEDIILLLFIWLFRLYSYCCRHTDPSWDVDMLPGLGLYITTTVIVLFSWPFIVAQHHLPIFSPPLSVIRPAHFSFIISVTPPC